MTRLRPAVFSVRQLATTTTLFVAAFWHRTKTNHNRFLLSDRSSTVAPWFLLLRRFLWLSPEFSTSSNAFGIPYVTAFQNSHPKTSWRVPTESTASCPSYRPSRHSREAYHPTSRTLGSYPLAGRRRTTSSSSTSRRCSTTSTSTSASSSASSTSSSSSFSSSFSSSPSSSSSIVGSVEGTTNVHQMAERNDIVVSPYLTMRLIHETDSTQDEAKRFLLEQLQNHSPIRYNTTNAPSENEYSTIQSDPSSTTKDHRRAFAVIAQRQTCGRGTQGRLWEYGRDNLFMTIALPIDSIPTRLTLLPLQVAVLIAQQVDMHLQRLWDDNSERQLRNSDTTTLTPPRRRPSRPKTTVKWPNDVLVNDQKISGTLIENCMVSPTSQSESYSTTTTTDADESVVYLLIGIGVNLMESPDLTESPGKQIRGATCLRDHYYCTTMTHGEDDNVSDCNGSTSSMNSTASILPTPHQMGVQLASSLVDWAFQHDRTVTKYDMEQQVLQNWKSFAEFGKLYELRGTVQEEQRGHYRGEVVMSVDIQDDGQLLVRGENGRERLLIADYMF